MCTYLYFHQVDGTSVAPPDLSGDAPVLNILKPIIPIFLEFLWKNSKFFGFHSFNHFLSNILAVYVPLGSQHRFNDISTPIGVLNRIKIYRFACL
jgi:hypothetical protein